MEGGGGLCDNTDMRRLVTVSITWVLTSCPFLDGVFADCHCVKLYYNHSYTTNIQVSYKILVSYMMQRTTSNRTELNLVSTATKLTAS